MELDIDGKTLGSVLREVVAKRRDMPFVSCEDESRTYGEFLEHADAFARGFLACGVKKGDKVALWAGNNVEWVEVYFALASIGAVLVTVNTRYHAEELRYLLEQSDSTLVVLQRSFLKETLLDRLVEVVPELEEEAFGTVKNAGLPLLRGAVTYEEEPLRGAISLAELARRGSKVGEDAWQDALRTPKPEDTALMIYTSGTTGNPKGVEQQHVALLNRMFRFCRWNRMTEDDTTFFALPLFHSFGAVVAVLATLLTGSRLCMLEKFRTKKALELIERERCTVIHGVPSSFYMMLRDPDFGSYDLSCGRTGVLGGAQCPPELAQEIMDKIAPDIAGAWGQTETCGMVTANAPEDTAEQVCRTVGHVIPGSEVAIVDVNTGERLPAGSQGEVLVLSPYNMKGYYRMPEETAKAVDEDGFLHTGDVGWFGEDGCLRISGRLKDMFIVGGVNAYPVEIENHIRTMPGVGEVEVVGVPDERLGEVACAYVIPDGTREISAQDVVDFCSSLANYKIPRYVRFVTAYPTTANGKVKKYVLRQMFAREQGDVGR